MIIVQENRTPDNLFGSTGGSWQCNGQDDFEPGVDIQNWGFNGATHQCFVSRPLTANVDPGHYHHNFVTMCDINMLTGVCQMDACSGGTDCYSFVPKSDVQPYFDIATTYGFANYMFQTNEGPSFEAHQFLFSGTSAPVGVNGQTYFDWFALDNPTNFFNDAGCSSIDTQNNEDFVNGIKWNGSIQDGSSTYPWYIPPPPPTLNYSYPCYEHRTLSDLLDDNDISWKYYAPEEGAIWSAPTAIEHLCGTVKTFPCPNFQPSGGKYANNVIFENGTDTAPILNDLALCNLAAVSWVIPDFKWSDHPNGPSGGDQNGSGPSYVANIVNAIGGATTCDKGAGYWSDTAIFITWDDWGGWYDHVNPSIPPAPGVKLSCGSSGWGCGNTYGFRVPLLVVSPYTGILTNGVYSGYISGNTITQGGERFPYIHDFGSILAYIEYNFLGAGQIGNINQQYPFADAHAPDGAGGNIPLQDFFGLTTRRRFVKINASYPASYFTNNPAGPEGPGDNGDPD